VAVWRIPLVKTKKDKLSAKVANLGFEETLWQAADKLRGHMDAGEYKHVVLGLVFLKYISDAFGEHYDKLSADEYADPEDRDEYTAENIFYVPKEARWSFLQSQAKTPEIGKLIDDGMSVIEKENPSLKGVLPKEYGKPSLDKRLLGELIDLIATIGLGDQDNRSQDILGRVYLRCRKRTPVTIEFVVQTNNNLTAR
jgi:type I restriction enzyme M protein